MSIQQILNGKYLPIETANRFRADFNTPPGQYGFQGSAAAVAQNTRALVLEMEPEYVYFIDRLSFSASIDEGVYLRAFDPGDRPEIRLFLRERSPAIFPRPFPAINYKDNLELNFWFYNLDANNALLATMSGTLNQPAELVGVDTVFAQLSLVVYQIEQTEEIVNYLRRGYMQTVGRESRLVA